MRTASDRPSTPASKLPFARPSKAALAFALAAASLPLGGCLFGDDAPDLRKPAALSPESDLFSQNSVRAFSWTEGIERGKRDTTLRVGSLTATHKAAIQVGSETYHRVTLSSTSGAAAEVTQLGLDPARLLLDSVHALDAGPGLPFPAAPAVGWRLDTTVGDLRFVRELTKVETLRSAGKRIECWVFAESTYWGNQPVSFGQYWMGQTGLVRHRREWKSFQPGDNVTGGTLWREIKAL